MSKRINHAPAFKARVALAAPSEEKTVAELSAAFGVHQTRIHKWVKQLKGGGPAAGIFSGEIKADADVPEAQNQHPAPRAYAIPASIVLEILQGNIFLLCRSITPQ